MDPFVLKTIDVFAGLGEERVLALASTMRERSVPQGAVVVNQGELSRTLFAILEGRADVLRDGRRIATLRAGECFGEVGAFERRARTATVVTTSPVRLTELTRWDLERLEPDVLKAIQDGLSRRIAVHVEE